VSVQLGVAKVIFYGFACLHNYENVEFVTNSPERCETVLDTGELDTVGSYYNVLRNGDGYDLIFRDKMSISGGSACFYNTETQEMKKILQSQYLLTDNFCVIKPKDNDGYYAVGGEHNKSLHRIMGSSGPTINYRGRTIPSPEVYSQRHFNGLYLMHSKDLLHWDYVRKVPVISGIHPGQTDNFQGYSRFDSKISCFYSKRLEEYIIFVRANMGRGRRWVQTARSKDLIDWSPLQLLHMDGVDFNKDNYYCLEAMEYPDADLFVGISAYTNKPRYPTETCIKLMFSKDGVHWIDRGSILETPTSADGYRNSVQPTCVFFDNGGDHYDMFLNENYNRILTRNEGSNLVNYTIPKDRLVGVKAADTGRVEFDMGIRSDRLIVNYDAHGYIKFTINDDPEEFFLQGNELNKEIVIDEKYIGQNVRIKAEMNNAILYAFSS